MKSVSIAVGAGVAAAALGASSASAADWYVSGALGGVFRAPYTASVDQPTDPFGNRVFANGQPVPYRVTQRYDYDPGFEVDAAVGRRFNLGPSGALRVEAEFSFRDYQVSSVATNSLPGQQLYDTTLSATFKTSSGFHEQRYAQTANLFYDLTKFSGFTPYVGVGVGYEEGAHTSGVGVRTAQIVSGGVPSSSVSTVHVASVNADDGTWLAEAGVALPLTKHLSIAPAYRFSQAFAGDRPVHQLRVALRYSF